MQLVESRASKLRYSSILLHSIGFADQLNATPADTYAVVADGFPYCQPIAADKIREVRPCVDHVELERHVGVGLHQVVA